MHPTSMDPISLRREIHKFPELSHQEFKTTKLLLEQIELIKIKYQDLVQIKISRPLDTGLLVHYQSKNILGSVPFTLLRADIDALPISEKTNYQFKSHNGNMHACAHDVHTAILYGFLEYLASNNIDTNVLLLFQPAEEIVDGALKILKSGILENYTIRNAFCLHVTDEYPLGTVATNSTALFSAGIVFNCTCFGRSSHIAFPHLGRNALTAMRSFLDEIDKISIDPANKLLLAIGKFESGVTHNIVPEKAYIEGTIRSPNQDYLNDHFLKIQDIANGLEKIHDVKFEINVEGRYPAVVNNLELFELAKKRLKGKFNFIECQAKMTGEDFSHFSNKYNSLMVWLGCLENGSNRFGLHNPSFLPPEDTIKYGIYLLKNLLFKNILKDIVL